MLFSLFEPFSSYNKFHVPLGLLGLFFLRVFVKFHFVVLFLWLVLYLALSFPFKFKLMLSNLAFLFPCIYFYDLKSQFLICFT